MAFLVTSIRPPESLAQTVVTIPAPGALVRPTPKFAPPVLRGIKLHPENALKFDFIVDKGDSPLSNAQIKAEGEKLIKYFLAAMTTPEDGIWVNLSPYEQDRVIPDKLSVTDMGRDLLAQDYILKQLTASLMYPETGLGKDFWDKVFRRAYELYGTTRIPINTFNKVWIVPDRAVVYQYRDTAFVAESRLKVMLEADYLALGQNLNDKDNGTDRLSRQDVEQINDVSSQIVKELLLPAIESEINDGENFYPLRQIYHSLILATWFKKKLRDSPLGKVYVDENKVDGIDTADKEDKQKIYDRYVEAFKKGVYDYVKEDFDEITQKKVFRQYFSGGVDVAQMSERTEVLVFDAFADLASLSKSFIPDLAALSVLPTSLTILQRGEDLQQNQWLDTAEMHESLPMDNNVDADSILSGRASSDAELWDALLEMTSMDAEENGRNIIKKVVRKTQDEVDLGNFYFDTIVLEKLNFGPAAIDLSNHPDGPVRVFIVDDFHRQDKKMIYVYALLQNGKPSRLLGTYRFKEDSNRLLIVSYQTPAQEDVNYKKELIRKFVNKKVGGDKILNLELDGDFVDAEGRIFFGNDLRGEKIYIKLGKEFFGQAYYLLVEEYSDPKEFRFTIMTGKNENVSVFDYVLNDQYPGHFELLNDPADHEMEEEPEEKVMVNTVIPKQTGTVLKKLRRRRPDLETLKTKNAILSVISNPNPDAELELISREIKTTTNAAGGIPIGGPIVVSIGKTWGNREVKLTILRYPSDQVRNELAGTVVYVPVVLSDKGEPEEIPLPISVLAPDRTTGFRQLPRSIYPFAYAFPYVPVDSIAGKLGGELQMFKGDLDVINARERIDFGVFRYLRKDTILKLLQMAAKQNNLDGVNDLTPALLKQTRLDILQGKDLHFILIHYTRIAREEEYPGNVMSLIFDDLGVKPREIDVQGKVESEGLQELVASPDASGVGEILALLLRGKLAPEEIKELLRLSFHGLGGRGIAGILNEEATYTESNEPLILDTGLKIETDKVFVEISGRAGKIFSKVLVSGDRNFDVPVVDGRFKAKVILQKGQVLKLTLTGINDAKKTRSPPLEITLRQTSPAQSFDEALELYLASHPQVESEFSSAGRNFNYLKRFKERQLMIHFADNEEDGFKELDKIIAAQSNSLLKKLYEEIRVEFRSIDKNIEGMVGSLLNKVRPLRFDQKWVLNKIRQRIDDKESPRGLFLGLEMGGGKTLIMLLAAGYLFKKTGIKTIVVTKNPLKSQWGDEAQKFLSGLNAHVVKGSTRAAKAKSIRDSSEPIIILNSEAFSADEENLAPIFEAIEKTTQGKYAVFIDEGDFLRNSESKQSKGLAQLKGKFRINASGTLFTKLEDIRPMLADLFPDDPVFQSENAFNQKYDLSDPEKFVELLLFLSENTIRLTSKEVFKIVDPDDSNKPLSQQANRLPKMVVIPPDKLGNYILTKLQTWAIFKMFTNWDGWKKDYNDACASGKVPEELRFAYGDSGLDRMYALMRTLSDPRHIGATDGVNPKLEKLKEILKKEILENNGRVVISAGLRSDIRMLQKAVNDLLKENGCKGCYAVTYYGETNDEENTRNGFVADDENEIIYWKTDASGAFVIENGMPVEDPENGVPMTRLDYNKIIFNNNHDQVKVLITNDQMGSLGLNLANGTTMALRWGMEKIWIAHSQFNKRVNRPVSEGIPQEKTFHVRLSGKYDPDVLEEIQKMDLWVFRTFEGKAQIMPKHLIPRKVRKVQSVFDYYFRQGTFEEFRARLTDIMAGTVGSILDVFGLVDFNLDTLEQDLLKKAFPALYAASNGNGRRQRDNGSNGAAHNDQAELDTSKDNQLSNNEGWTVGLPISENLSFDDSSGRIPPSPLAGLDTVRWVSSTTLPNNVNLILSSIKPFITILEKFLKDIDDVPDPGDALGTIGTEASAVMKIIKKFKEEASAMDSQNLVRILILNTLSHGDPIKDWDINSILASFIGYGSMTVDNFFPWETALESMVEDFERLKNLAWLLEALNNSDRVRIVQLPGDGVEVIDLHPPDDGAELAVVKFPGETLGPMDPEKLLENLLSQLGSNPGSKFRLIVPAPGNTEHLQKYWDMGFRQVDEEKGAMVETIVDLFATDAISDVQVSLNTIRFIFKEPQKIGGKSQPDIIVFLPGEGSIESQIPSKGQRSLLSRPWFSDRKLVIQFADGNMDRIKDTMSTLLMRFMVAGTLTLRIPGNAEKKIFFADYSDNIISEEEYTALSRNQSRSLAVSEPTFTQDVEFMSGNAQTRELQRAGQPASLINMIDEFVYVAPYGIYTILKELFSGPRPSLGQLESPSEELFVKFKNLVEERMNWDPTLRELFEQITDGPKFDPVTVGVLKKLIELNKKGNLGIFPQENYHRDFFLVLEYLVNMAWPALSFELISEQNEAVVKLHILKALIPKSIQKILENHFSSNEGNREMGLFIFPHGLSLEEHLMISQFISRKGIYNKNMVIQEIFDLLINNIRPRAIVKLKKMFQESARIFPWVNNNPGAFPVALATFDIIIDEWRRNRPSVTISESQSGKSIVYEVSYPNFSKLGGRGVEIHDDLSNRSLTQLAVDNRLITRIGWWGYRLNKNGEIDLLDIHNSRVLSFRNAQLLEFILAHLRFALKSTDIKDGMKKSTLKFNYEMVVGSENIVVNAEGQTVAQVRRNNGDFQLMGPNVAGRDRELQTHVSIAAQMLQQRQNMSLAPLMGPWQDYAWTTANIDHYVSIDNPRPGDKFAQPDVYGQSARFPNLDSIFTPGRRLDNPGEVRAIKNSAEIIGDELANQISDLEKLISLLERIETPGPVLAHNLEALKTRIEGLNLIIQDANREGSAARMLFVSGDEKLESINFINGVSRLQLRSSLLLESLSNSPVSADDLKSAMSEFRDAVNVLRNFYIFLGYVRFRENFYTFRQGTLEFLNPGDVVDPSPVGMEDLLKLNEIFAKVYKQTKSDLDFDRAMGWFLPYARMDKKTLEEIIRGGLTAERPAQGNLGYDLEANEQAAVAKVAQSFRESNEPRIVLTSLSSSPAPHELAQSLDVVVNGYSREQQKPEVVLVAYDRYPSTLGEVEGQLKKKILEVEQNDPRWQGRLKFRVFYGNLANANEGNPARWKAQLELIPSNVIFLRNSWLSSQIGEPSLRALVKMIEENVAHGAVIVHELLPVSSGKFSVIPEYLSFAKTLPGDDLASLSVFGKGNPDDVFNHDGSFNAFSEIDFTNAVFDRTGPDGSGFLNLGHMVTPSSDFKGFKSGFLDSFLKFVTPRVITIRDYFDGKGEGKKNENIDNVVIELRGYLRTVGALFSSHPDSLEYIIMQTLTDPSSDFEVMGTLGNLVSQNLSLSDELYLLPQEAALLVNRFRQVQEINRLQWRQDVPVKTIAGGKKVVDLDKLTMAGHDLAIGSEGGINLSADKMNIEIRGESGAGAPVVPLLPYDPAQLETMPINGFYPVIEGVLPVKSLPWLLGVSEAEDQKEFPVDLRTHKAMTESGMPGSRDGFNNIGIFFEEISKARPMEGLRNRWTAQKRKSQVQFLASRESL